MRSSKPGGRLLRPGRIHGDARAHCDHEDDQTRREMSALLLGEEAAVADAAPLVVQQLEEAARVLGGHGCGEWRRAFGNHEHDEQWPADARTATM